MYTQSEATNYGKELLKINITMQSSSPSSKSLAECCLHHSTPKRQSSAHFSYSFRAVFIVLSPPPSLLIPASSSKHHAFHIVIFKPL